MSRPERRRESTSTSNFGVGRREGHDSSAFYSRFPVPEISEDERVVPADRASVNQLWEGDARDLLRSGRIADSSVALVVTSPPYFAGKEYEEALGKGHTPDSYVDYLDMLTEVFEQCAKKLEAGGRIAVNVANLGRKPYRSLSADVIEILQNRLRLLLRGEIIWQKAEGAAGNCAWGTYQRPGNPVLRDLTERIVIASKGRFNRAVSPARRARENLPSEGSIFSDDFLGATTDIWHISPASATRVGHPAPFPVELPQRLIELYTYCGDLVLDPFIGSGTTAVAAIRTDRHYVGVDTDPAYLRIARQRIEEERSRREQENGAGAIEVRIPPVRTPAPAQTEDDDFQARAVREGRKARDIARALLQTCGFTDIRQDVKHPSGVEINFVARDTSGSEWRFDVSGAFTVTQRAGLRRTDTLWKALGKASTLFQSDPVPVPLVLLTTNRPAPRSVGERALDTHLGNDKPVRAVVEMLNPQDKEQLAELAKGRSSR